MSNVGRHMDVEQKYYHQFQNGEADFPVENSKFAIRSDSFFEAAVDHKICAGDVARAFGGEERNGIADLFGPSKPPGGDFLG